jgi:hypothetical protein
MIVFLISINYVLEKYVIGMSEGNGAYKVERLLNKNDKEETPILGSSRAEGSIFPDSLGKDFFNYGLAGVQDNVWIYFLKRELEKNHKTPILINFDLDGLGYDNGGVDYWLPNSMNSEIRVFFDNWKPIYWIPTIKYFGVFELYLVNYLQQKFMITGIMNRGALLEKKVLLPEEFDLLATKRVNTNIKFKNDTILLNQLLKILKANNQREIVFFIPPYHKSYLKSIENFDTALLFLKTLDQMDHVTVLNYCDLNFEQNKFFNTTHLNYHGAVMFTALLKKDLIKRGLITLD